MKHPFVFCLATVAVLVSAGTSSHAQPVAGMAKSAGVNLQALQSDLVEVGWKAKRKRAGMRRANRRNGFRSDQRASAMWPYLPGPVVDEIVRRSKKPNRCELIPGGCDD